jgi:hypothetical protein
MGKRGERNQEEKKEESVHIEPVAFVVFQKGALHHHKETCVMCRASWCVCAVCGAV